MEQTSFLGQKPGFSSSQPSNVSSLPRLWRLLKENLVTEKSAEFNFTTMELQELLKIPFILKSRERKYIPEDSVGVFFVVFFFFLNLVKENNQVIFKVGKRHCQSTK